MDLIDINRHIRKGKLPLHVAVELAVPGALVNQWRVAGKMVLMELLVLTRWRALFDTLPRLSAEATADGRFQALESDVYWSITEFVGRIVTAVEEIAAQAGGCPAEAGSRFGRLLRSTDPNCVAAEKAVWQAVRDLGPPTLEEIVYAAEGRAAR